MEQKTVIELSADEYLDLIENPRKLGEGVQIHVNGDVDLPEKLESLPDYPTVFGRNLNASKTSLSTFNHKVTRDSNFKGVGTLVELGPDAEFGRDVNLVGTRIDTFNHKVGRDATFMDVSTLTELGPDAEFGRDVNLSGTRISNFNHKVARDTAMRGVHTLTNIGRDAEFGRDLDAYGTSIHEFNNKVGRSANFRDILPLADIGPDAEFGGELDIENTGIALQKEAQTVGALRILERLNVAPNPELYALIPEDSPIFAIYDNAKDPESPIALSTDSVHEECLIEGNSCFAAGSLDCATYILQNMDEELSELQAHEKIFDAVRRQEKTVEIAREMDLFEMEA